MYACICSEKYILVAFTVTLSLIVITHNTVPLIKEKKNWKEEETITTTAMIMLKCPLFFIVFKL